MKETTKTNPMLGKTTVRPCTCHHVFQDKRYGKGMRLHNYCKRAGGLGCRCTVCGREKDR